MTKYVYGESVFVGFVDVLGFRSAMNHRRESRSSGQLIFNLWRNCFLPLRKRLSTANFVQLSDSLVLYDRSAETVLDLVCDIYGRALVFGVPIRGGLGHGELFHLEDHERPGTAITLFGAGQIDAYETEQSAKGCGMRLFLSSSFLSKLTNPLPDAREHCCGRTEYAWWHRAGIERSHFRERVDNWWNRKNVREWFRGSHRIDTERVFKLALAELSS